MRKKELIEKIAELSMQVELQSYIIDQLSNTVDVLENCEYERKIEKLLEKISKEYKINLSLEETLYWFKTEFNVCVGEDVVWSASDRRTLYNELLQNENFIFAIKSYLYDKKQKSTKKD